MSFHATIAPPLAVMVFAFSLPVHAGTAAPELEYQSAFDGYQSYTDTEIIDWPAVNRHVGEIGGWRVYAREPRQVIPAEKAANLPKYGEPAEPHHQGARP